MSIQANAPGGQEEQELIRKFTDGDLRLSELPEKLQQKLLFESVTVEPEQESVSQEPVAEAPQPEAEPVADEAEAKQEDEERKPAEADKKGKRPKRSVEDLRKLALERADRINALEQKQRSHEHRLKNDPDYRAAYFKDLGIEPQKQPQSQPVEVWSDDHQRKLVEKLESQERELAEIRTERQLSKLYNELETFAKKEVGHKFDSQIAEIDKATKLLQATTGKEPTAEQIAELGFDESDVVVYDRLVKVQQFQMSGKYPTFASAWYDFERLNGKINVAADTGHDLQAADEGEQDKAARREKMQKALNAPKLMTSQRAMQADQGLTPEYAAGWLAKHPDPRSYSEEDRSTWARIKKLMEM